MSKHAKAVTVYGAQRFAVETNAAGWNQSAVIFIENSFVLHWPFTPLGYTPQPINHEE